MGGEGTYRHLRSTLGLKTHTVDGVWETASRERVRELAFLPNLTHALRERRLHVRRSIMCSPPDSIMRALLEEEDWAPRTRHCSPDWGKLTARDMTECGMTEEMAELPSEWNKRCAAEKGKKEIPYTDADDDNISAWANRKTFLDGWLELRNEETGRVRGSGRKMDVRTIRPRTILPHPRETDGKSG